MPPNSSGTVMPNSPSSFIALDDLRRVAPGLLPLARDGDDLAVDELPQNVAKRALVVGEAEVHRRVSSWSRDRKWLEVGHYRWDGVRVRPALDATMRGVPISGSAAWAASAEREGFDGIVVTETNNDPFLPLALAATSTRDIGLATGIALALPRSPMEVAYTSWNLQDLSGGRFTLGLGTQVRAHVERRYGVPWTRPAARMREYVLALRAIWSAWETGDPLRFEGEFSSHTLMPPAFRPRPQPHGAPQVWLAAVRERMIEVAGEVADGLLVHPLQSPRTSRRSCARARAGGGARRARPVRRSACRWRSSSRRRPPSSRPSAPGWRSTARRRATGTSSRCTASTISSASSTSCRGPGAGTA